MEWERNYEEKHEYAGRTNSDQDVIGQPDGNQPDGSHPGNQQTHNEKTTRNC